ncbi:MAG: carboxypeptidase regulatory-like domain-containing protein [Thermoanaerobaculia bacterium]
MAETSLAEVVRIRGLVERAVPEDATAVLFAVEGTYERSLREIEGTLRPEPAALAAVAADGWFELEAPEPGMWKVLLEAPGFRSEEFPLAPLLENRTLPAVELVASTKIEVRVLSNDGASVSGALVAEAGQERWRPEGWRPAPRRAKTSAEGIAVLERGEDERLTLAAYAQGLGGSDKVESAAEPMTIRLSPRSKTLVAAVIDTEGRPAPRVVVLFDDPAWPAGLTDDSGSVSVAVSGKQPRIAILDERGARESHGVTARELSDGRVGIELPAMQSVAGRVIDRERRQPIAGAFVWADGAKEFAVQTDASGHYSVPAFEGWTSYLMAAARGHFPDGTRVRNTAEGFEEGPTLALKPGARVRGHVLDQDRQPLAGVTVKAVAKRNNRMVVRRMGLMDGPARANTLADGVFEIGPLDPAAAHTLIAQREGLAPGREEVSGLEPLSTLGGVEIVLRSGSGAIGRVVDQESRPIVGAQIELREARPARRFRMATLDGTDEDALSASSDSEGRFSFDHLNAGDFDLSVEATGFAPAKLPGLSVGAGGDHWGDIVLKPGVAIEGRVVNEVGQPLEGVSVHATEPSPMSAMMFRFELAGTPPTPAATTAADGFFRAGDRRPGEKVDLIFRKSGYAMETMSAVEAPPFEPVTVEMESAAIVSGRVLDPSGAGIAQAQIRATGEGGGATAGGRVMMRAMLGMAMSDTDGYFELEDMEPGVIRLTVRAQGWRAAELGGLKIPKGEDVSDLEITLLEGASIEGRVLGADNAPVAGALVRLDTPGVRFGGAAAQADGDGRYLLDGIEPGRQKVIARDEELGEVAEEIEVDEGTNRLDLVYSGGTFVEGRVVDHLGGPVPGAEVSLRQQGQVWGGAHATSDASGTFRFEGVRDGLYSLQAEREGHASGERPEPVEIVGQPVVGLEVALGAAGTIRGQLLGVDADEVSDVVVWARGDRSRWQRGTTVFDGTYVIRDLPAGEWSVSASSSSTGRQADGRATLGAGGDEVLLDLEFGAGLTLSGGVVVGEEPLSGVTIFASGTDISSRGSATTNHEGRFVIQGLEAGNYEILVRSFETGFNHSQELELLADYDLEIELETARVSGLVLASDSLEPIDAAVVSFEPLDRPTDGVIRTRQRGGSSDSNGNFLVYDVVPGTYKAVANKSGFAPGEQVFTVAGGEVIEDLEFRLSPTEGLAIRALLPNGSPAGPLDSAVLDPSGNTKAMGRYTPDSKGLVRFPTVPPGRWTVLIAVAGTAVAEVPVTAPGPEVPVTLAREARLEVEVPELRDTQVLATLQVVGRNGRPFRSVTWGGRVRSDFRFSNGRITLSALPPGAWRLEVRTPDGRSWSEDVTTASGQTTSVVVD